jgi:tetratricopeptide (TPR) repeat protein
MIPTPISALLHYKGCDPKDNRTSTTATTTTSKDDSSHFQSSSCSGSRSSNSDNYNAEDEFPVLQRVVSELQWAQKEYGFHHPKVAEAWNALGLVKIHMQRDPTQALMCHEHALRIFRELDQEKKRHEEPQEHDQEQSQSDADAAAVTAASYATATAITLNDVAYCHEQLQQTEQALQFYQESLQIMQQHDVSQYHPHMVSATRALFRLGRA